LLRLHLRAVQVADALSLGLCCTHPPARRTRQVHASVGAAPIVLEQWRIYDGTLCVRPWPFNRPRLEFTVPVRRPAAKHWASASDYQAAFAAADAEPLRLTISAG
jgi:hypothetical protein